MTLRAVLWSLGLCYRVSCSLYVILHLSLQLWPSQNWIGEGGGRPSLSWRDSWWGKKIASWFQILEMPHLTGSIIDHNYIKQWCSQPLLYYQMPYHLFHIFSIAHPHFDVQACFFPLNFPCRWGSCSNWGKPKGKHQSEWKKRELSLTKSSLLWKTKFQALQRSYCKEAGRWLQ